MGLSAPTYYGGFCPFLNWWKQAAPVTLTLSGGRQLAGRQAWEAGGYLDPATSGLLNPVPLDVIAISRIFFTSSTSFQTGIGCDYSGEEFALVWDGAGTGRIDLLTESGSQTTAGPNRVDFIMGQSPGNTSVTLTITDRSDPPRNIRIFQKRYAQNIERGEIFNPDWLAEISKFTSLRLMDWQAINNSNIEKFSQLATVDDNSWCQPFDAYGAYGDQGPRGSIHPALLCELANRTGCELHVCIPHRADNDFVESFARYFKDHTAQVVTYEFSNECWNNSFGQAASMQEWGSALWRDDPRRGHLYYGYRAAACMGIVRRVYDDRSRWRGALATQTVNPEITRACLEGVSAWIAKESRALITASDLFDSLYVTGYFGDVISCTQPIQISRGNPAIIASPGHGYATGQRVRAFIAEGMTELDGASLVVTRLDENSYSVDRDTRGYGEFMTGGSNYVAPADVFDLIDESRSKNASDPVGYPTKYTFFNHQLADSLRTGSCAAGFATIVSLDALAQRHWPDQRRLAQQHALSLRQYEGGCHFVGDGYLTGFGGNAEYVDYLLHHGHSPQTASLYRDMYKRFKDIGGEIPSKYLADGPVSQYGTWSGVRYWPTVANGNTSDSVNPVWQETLAAN